MLLSSTFLPGESVSVLTSVRPSFTLQSLRCEVTPSKLAGVKTSVGSARLEPKLSATELRAWQALLHAHHDITRRLDAELRTEHELSFGAYDVLLRLARAPDRSLRMTELAERVMLSPSGLTRLVDQLSDEGLVRRERVPQDARGVMAQLTDRGRQVLRRAAKTHLRGIREHFTGRLSEGQLRALASALEVIAGSHEPHWDPC
jgi:DNA-binding MarR family transcriptional regulator